jgi:hypothetical protein
LSEDKIATAIYEAQRADNLLNDDLLNKTFATIRQTYIDALISSHVDDEKGREKLYLAINIVGKVRDHLQAVLDNGKLAKAELDRLR